MSPWKSTNSSFSDLTYSIFNKDNTERVQQYVSEYQLYKAKLLTVEYVTLTQYFDKLE